MIVSFGGEPLRPNYLPLTDGSRSVHKAGNKQVSKFCHPTLLPPCDMELRPGTWQSTYSKRIKGPQAKQLFDVKRPETA